MKAANMKKDWSGYTRMARHLEPTAGHLADLVGGQAGPWIDIGSGTGNGLRAAQNRGRLAIGVDLASGQLRAAQLVTGLPQVQADGCVLPVRSGSVGAVTSNFGLIFATDPSLVLAEAARSLWPGGLLAFTTWTPQGWPNPARQILWNHLPGAHIGVTAPPFPVELGVEGAAERSLVAAGFSNVRVYQGVLRWTFSDLDDAVETLTTAAGGLRSLREQTEMANTWEAAREALRQEIAGRLISGRHGVHVDDQYVLGLAEAP